MKLGELLLISTKGIPPKGSISSICVVCSSETEKGVSLKQCVSDKFTGWNKFFMGNCMCSECAFLFSDQTFRKKSWVASPAEFRIFKNDEACNILFNPPEPPFFIHIAKKGQRQAWLSCLHKVAYNHNRYFFSHEDYDIPIMFEKEKAEFYLEQALQALNYGITKTELKTAVFKTTTWKKAVSDGFGNFLRELAKNKGDVLWEVIVDVSRKPGSTSR